MRPLLAVTAVLGAGALTIGAQQPSAPLPTASAPAHGVIAGRVVDTLGDPTLSAHIAIEEPAASGTPRTVAMADTDDRGEYRVAHLKPGTYYVALVQLQVYLTPTPGAAPRPPVRTYFGGGSTQADAEPIDLGADDERDDIDFATPPDNTMLPASVNLRLTIPLPEATTTGTATIRGRVVDVDGRGVPHARVRVAPGSLLQSRGTIADASGRWEVGALAAGTYSVEAFKNGYAPATTIGRGFFGENVVSMPPIQIADGDTREVPDLQLARWSAISGRVVDENDKPVFGATVQLMQIGYERGRRRLVASGPSHRTDDRGRYRMYGLLPGEYIVSAAAGLAGTDDVAGYAQTYFPSTTNPAGAQFISVTRAQELDGVDVSLAKTRTARVSGRVIDAAGEPTNPGRLTLEASVRSSLPVSVSLPARLSGAGAFEFPNVPPGQYVIRADRGRLNPSKEGDFGTLPVVVDGEDIKDLVVQTSAGSTIAGTLVFDTRDRSRLPRPGAFEISPIPVDFDLAPSMPASTDFNDDGTFTLTGINGPRRLELTRAPRGWALEQIRIGGDATDRAIPFGRREQSLTGVEVIVTDRITELAGTVADADGHAAPGSSIVVFATDRDRWYAGSRFMARTTAGADGTFNVGGLPFGSYYAAPIAAGTRLGDDWRDPTILDALVARATTVTLTEDRRQTLTLQLPTR